MSYDTPDRHCYVEYEIGRVQNPPDRSFYDTLLMAAIPQVRRVTSSSWQLLVLQIIETN